MVYSQISYSNRNLAQHFSTDNGLHSYTYNHEGLRIGKRYSHAGQDDWSVNTRYVYGAYGELLAQYDGLSHQYWNIRRWADSVSTPDGETIGRMEASPPESKDDILAMNAGTFSGYDRYYYLKDHTSTTLSTGLGSIRVTLKDNGSVAGYACPECSRRDDYYPFGLQLPGRGSNTANTHADQITCPDASGYTGHFLESEGNLGLYHAQARLYDPEVPRFYGVDAMRGDMPGWNPYHYTFNDPVRFVDPDGNMPDCPNCSPVDRAWRTGEGMFNTAMTKISSTATSIERGITMIGKFAYAGTAEPIVDGMDQLDGSLSMATEGLKRGDLTMTLDGLQSTLDATADVSGGIETASVIALPFTAGGSSTTLLVSGGVARASDGGETLIEVIKYFSGDSSIGSLGSRSAWTLFNFKVAGRVPSKYQHGEEFIDNMIGQASSTTQEILEDENE